MIVVRNWAKFIWPYCVYFVLHLTLSRANDTTIWRDKKRPEDLSRWFLWLLKLKKKSNYAKQPFFVADSHLLFYFQYFKENGCCLLLFYYICMPSLLFWPMTLVGINSVKASQVSCRQDVVCRCSVCTVCRNITNLQKYKPRWFSSHSRVSTPLSVGLESPLCLISPFIYGFYT